MGCQTSFEYLWSGLGNVNDGVYACRLPDALRFDSMMSYLWTQKQLFY